MTVFALENATKSKETQRIYAYFELLHTLIDFGAAICFLIGSVMFFYSAWLVPGTWLFVIGSLLFAAKPTTRLLRELRLLAMGDVADVAPSSGNQND